MKNKTNGNKELVKGYRNFVIFLLIISLLSGIGTYFLASYTKDKIVADASIYGINTFDGCKSMFSDPTRMVCIASLQKPVGPAGYDYKFGPGFNPSVWWINKKSSSFLDCSAYLNVVLWLSYGEIMNWTSSSGWERPEIPTKKGRFVKITDLSGGLQRGDVLWRKGHVAMFASYDATQKAGTDRPMTIFDASAPGTISGKRNSSISKWTNGHAWRYIP